MKLTVVGCAGSYPGPASPCSCYLIEAEGYRLVVDMGNGALGALARHAPVEAVDAVLLSHLHADHCIDLTGYFVVRNYHPGGPLPRLPVHGPAATAARLARAYEVPCDDGRSADPDLSAAFDFRTVETGTFGIGPFRITAARVNHPVPSFAYRVEHGDRALVYSGDTAASDALVTLAAGADLLLCEASFEAGRDTVPGIHLNGREAGEHAARAGVGRLVVTHIPPWTDPARNLSDAAAAFGGPTELAVAGAAYDV